MTNLIWNWITLVTVGALLLINIKYTSGACTWPSYFINSQWEDSSKGQLTFTANEMTGWNFQVKSGSTLSRWGCHSLAWLETDGYLVLITTDVFAPFGTDFYGYLCLKLIQITDTSYRYYQYNPQQSQLYNERVFMTPSNTSDTTDRLCLGSSTHLRPADSEYKVLIRTGEALSAKIQCPYTFLGKYGYTHTTVSNTVSCDKTVDVMDTCTDNTQVTFSYTTCTTRIAYSASDTVWCVDTVEYSGNNYVTMYNGNDADSSIDDTTTFRFSCLAVSSSDGTSASITPSSCKKDQVPSSIPTNVQTGNAEGALLGLAELESCALLTAPQSGTISYTTSGAVTTANYACGVQYSLAGDASRTCLSNHTWSSQAPTCTCILPNAPDNGSVSVSNDGLSLIYSCNAGFVLNGDVNRICSSELNTWTGNDPTCDPCDDFANIPGLTWTLSVDGSTTRAEFTCQTNYTLDGSTSSTCLTSGNWNVSVPSCVSCDAQTDPSSGTVSLSTGGYLTSAVFACVSGYHLVGETRLSCGVGGNWNGSNPTCECDSPPSPSNGTVSSNGTIVSYTCTIGYTLSGVSDQTCGTDGSGWSGSTPTCGECQSLTDPDGGFVNLTTNGAITVATYSCLSGYSMNGNPTSYCQLDGSWNVSSPTCVQCATLTAPSSGNITLSTDSVTTQATFKCSTDYTLIGDGTSTCDSTGTWSTTTPTCLCDHVTVPSNGDVVYDTGNTTAYYSCVQGYSLSGSSVRTCGTDGSGWSGSDRTCEQCAGLTNVAGGNYTLSTNTVNSMVEFTCDVGYTINGNTRLTCQQDGSWDSSQPTCSMCTTLSASTGGNITLSTSGTTTQAYFTCDVGYTITGTSALTCDENGSWDFSPPTCAKCADRQAPASGSVAMTTDGETTVATYMCASGYTLDGHTSVTCLPSGNWNLPEPTCNCDTPTGPLNGGVSVSGDDVTYSCDVGFTMSGTAIGVCQADGSGWNISIPSCSTCDTLFNITGGNLTLVSNGYTTEAVYTCPSGSSLNGSQTISCNGSGTWASSQPECVACPSLTQSVNSGSVAITTNGSVTIATYTCQSGYYVRGSTVLTCTADGVWDNSEPVCACDTLSTPSGGSVNISDDGLTATFECDVGYTINGDVNVTCATDGTGWTVSEPTCSQCNTLTNPVGGEVTYVTTGTQTNAVYNCSIGTTLSGQVQQPACQTDGTWDYSNSTCVTCPSDVLTLTNGDAVQITDGHTTVVTYSCSNGYDLVGAVNLTCLSSGLYDATQPVCYCSDPSQPTNGAVTVSVDRSMAAYSCDPGYILNGVVNRTCQNNSLGWSDTEPTCNSCDSLTAPDGGSFTLTTNGTVTTAQFSCTVGYTLNGTSGMSCLDDGTWSQSVPLCSKCQDVTSPNSGNVSLVTDGLTTTAYYICLTGYYVVGTDNQTCDSNGNWDDEQPRCVCTGLEHTDNGLVNISAELTTALFSCNVGYTINGVTTMTCASDGSGWADSSPTCVSCPSITGTLNGQYQTVSNGTLSSVEYTCDTGSSLNGSSTINCQSDGSWSTTESTCVECPALQEINSGNVTVATDGTTTTGVYTCYQGYSLVGETSRTCQTNGTWSAATPMCICENPPNITNGHVTHDANNTQALYTCDVYFSLMGLQQRSCLNDGTGWNGTEPVCVGCSTLQAPINGSINITTDGGQTSAVIECDLGTSLEGQHISVCGTDGQWSNAVLQCVSCGTPTNISSGNYRVSTNGTTTVVEYTCANEYSLSGNSDIVCRSDASWDSSFPSCVCDDPIVSTGGSISSDGVTVKYSCYAGYTINGLTSRTCGNDGSGWNGSDYTCSQCQSLSTPQNGSYVINTNGSTSTATFTCDQGTTRNGSRTITCLSDGNWDNVGPYCVTCDSLSQPANGQYTYTSDGETTSVALQCNTGYDETGTSTVTCQSDGTWNFQHTMTCEKNAVSSDDEDDSLLPVLIGVSVAAAVIILILSILLARFMYLYFKGNNVHSYTPRSTISESKVSHFDNNFTDEPYKIPLVKLNPAAAPMGHQHHVLVKGPLCSSPAPREHGNSIFDNGITPRSPPPSMIGYSPRSITSVSTLSLSHLKTTMLPPIKQNKGTPSLASEDTDLSLAPSPWPKKTLPKVFKIPNKNLLPTPSSVIVRPTTPVQHTMSIVEADDTPGDNVTTRSQMPVCD